MSQKLLPSVDSSGAALAQRPRRVVDLIAAQPPIRPACFDDAASWVAWLVAHHRAGERVVRRVDVGQKTPSRRTFFEVLPLDAIDHCQDCTASRRARMQAASRCVPSAAASGAGVPSHREAPAGESEQAPPVVERETAGGGSRERVARFRAKHRRFDWVPSDEALRIFEHYRRQHPGMAASAVLDRLVLLANRAISVSGNGR